MSVREFALPDLGEGLTESELVSWEVAVGDTVQLNQVIAEVETAKALVQLPSPYAGVVLRLLFEPGSTVRVGAPILAFEVADDAGDGDGDADAAAPAVERNAVLVGYGPRVDNGERPQRRRREGVGAVGAASAADVATTAGDEAASTGQAAERPRSTPPVRKLAHDRGIDLRALVGSGDDGAITREDVLAASGAAPGAASGAGAATGSPVAASGETRTPIRGVRKLTADAMVASAFTAPHVTVFLTVDVTPTIELIERLRSDAALAGHRITMLTMVAKALTIAIGRNPTINTRWDAAAGEIVQFGHVNLGIAAATPRGLIVPNIRHAQALGLTDLADALADLTARARAGTTPPTELAGGTITISNVGVFGVDAGTPILNPGEAAILALGAIRRRPWELRGELALRSVMTLSLSFDHRLVDGEQGSRFLADIGAILADPGRVLAMV